MLTPTIVEAILDGKYPAHLTLKDLMEPFPLEWDRQVAHFFVERSSTTGQTTNELAKHKLWNSVGADPASLRCTFPRFTCKMIPTLRGGESPQQPA